MAGTDGGAAVTFRIAAVEPFGRHQIILWLEDETTKARGPDGPDGPQWCVRVTMDEAPNLIERLVGAYAETMQHLAVDLAAGGCRTCRNERVVRGAPCPTCTPRAENRIRRTTFLPRRRA